MTLPLHGFHESLGAHFTTVNDAEVVADYGDSFAEHKALRETAGVLDLSFRGRLCVLGADRVRFLHGQITNDVKKLRPGEGCYAALVTAKGKMQSDLNLFCLADELLLDFEPGFIRAVTERLEKYLVADDVQVVDVAPHYGLLYVQGPKAGAAVRALGLSTELPARQFDSVKISSATLGEIYLMNHARLAFSSLSPRGPSGERAGERGNSNAQLSSPRPSPPEAEGEEVPLLGTGFDLFVPSVALTAMADKLIAATKSVGGGACGWTAFEIARIEAGIPRFGADMDETNIPLECGIEARAVSYNKGCYIGQEVINRIHSIGHVNRELRGLRLANDLKALPAKGDKLFKDGKEVGHITSSVHSPTLGANIALGYLRREVSEVESNLVLVQAGVESVVAVVPLPFT